jgi:hypothetical protein
MNSLNKHIIHYGTTGRARNVGVLLTIGVTYKDKSSGALRVVKIQKPVQSEVFYALDHSISCTDS